jgi:Mrp family chromosome partitioning ATPase
VSRIEDVLRKAAAEAAASGGTSPFLTGQAVGPLVPAEITVPWSFQEPIGVIGGGLDAADRCKVRVPLTAARPRAREPVADGDIVALIAQVFRKAEGCDNRRVLFTGVDDGRGSADVAVRVAQALARQDAGSVCLADLDVRAPTLDRYFQLQGHPGFSDAVLEAAPLGMFVHQIGDTTGLSIMPAGLRRQEAVALIGGAAAQHRIRELSAMFDYLVAHAAPAGVHHDAALLGPCLDGAVLVLEADATRATAARAVAEALQRATVHVLGAVLNNRTYPIPQAIYRWL